MQKEKMPYDVTTVTQRIKLNGRHYDEKKSNHIWLTRRGKGVRLIARRQRQTKGCRSAIT